MWYIERKQNSNVKSQNIIRLLPQNNINDNSKKGKLLKKSIIFSVVTFILS